MNKIIMAREFGSTTVVNTAGRVARTMQAYWNCPSCGLCSLTTRDPAVPVKEVDVWPVVCVGDVIDKGCGKLYGLQIFSRCKWV